MMTEEDTFRKLKRVPFNQMYEILEHWIRNPEDQREVSDILAAGGYTPMEWVETCERR